MNSPPLHILLADDDPDDCLLFTEALRELGLPVQLTTVPDGEQLMQLLNNKVNELPHVLFLDLNMPRKNGNECLLEIRRNENLKQLPVTIFSTSFVQETVNSLYQNGAQYYIRKPNCFSELKNVIHQAITLTAKKNVEQTPKENFVLTDKKNTYSVA